MLGSGSKGDAELGIVAGADEVDVVADRGTRAPYLRSLRSLTGAPGARAPYLRSLRSLTGAPGARAPYLRSLRSLTGAPEGDGGAPRGARPLGNLRTTRSRP
jgi:hypothetical protein